MKLTIKSLKQVPYEIEVENDSLSVKDLKIQFEKLHGFDHSSLKLVFNGVILDDSKKLSDYNMKEGNVIVMMNIKVQPKKKEESKVEEKVPEVTHVTEPVNQPTTTTSTSQQQQPKPDTTAKTTTTTAPKMQEKDYTPQVKELMDMGFPKSESEAAVKAARGDLSLSVEFLTNGIPEHLLSQGEGNVNAEVNPSATNAVLKNISSIVKVLCYNNPSQLQNILLTLQQSSPELIELIKENEDEFKTLIQKPITEEDIRAFNEFNRQAGLGGAGAESEVAGAGAGPEGEVFQQGGRNYIKLSKQDYEAVNKLKELGFSENDAVQAYFACDKNEEMAANLLWENKLRDQEQEQDFYIDCKIINGYIFIYRFSNRWRTIWN